MPQGTYTVLDDGPTVGTESFRCAPGPMGWRSFSEIDTAVPTPHHEIVDVAEEGYMMGDRLLRPARVLVNNPDRKPARDIFARGAGP